ncbi:hypothetical protein [Pseudovibrio sp. Tun.PSC04-5.I4]|uniref:hypothetical protein n=1 Tax=Pseudovibrio sp. Tun.PSC04-5.I4 TaxID=1798213 RepID=UPI00088CFD54|nr:hypothetical protein [Pseudovibrio sp. Tun.PSC04-5.I4]SDQ80501.1 hypothetical protein SAMN04515695_1465 [Pseudovibrio sp. Tun.PSC04-5.I4]
MAEQPVPLPMIQKDNMLFGSVALTNANTIAVNQIPSCYYMDKEHQFVRYRPLHAAGFAIFQRPSRVVCIFIGAWDVGQSFDWNVTRATNPNVYAHVLGSTKREIDGEIETLHSQHKITTTELFRKNANPPANRDRNLYYINDGALHGMFFQQLLGNHAFLPLRVADATTRANVAHTGHDFMKGKYLREYYDKELPGLLEKMELCGKNPQTLPTTAQFHNIATADPEPLITDRERLLSGALGATAAERTAFIQAVIRRFS